MMPKPSHYRPRLFPSWVYHARDGAMLALVIALLIFAAALVLEPMLAAP